MSLIEALQNEDYSTIRVVYGYRWLVWDRNGWTVYEQARRKRAIEVICTGDEDQAVNELLKGMD